ncbi:MAG: flagellar hook-associated protein 2 [Actinoplanes sp.]|jgi:flagellar hook-associated protein 2|nr:flagellar hook-associated protein 2 [Actinoplanes sp.]
MALSVDGLITGMNTTDTVKQLMQVEAIPQAALQTKASAQTKIVTAYQSVNSRMSSLVTAAQALGNANTWGAMRSTSSSDAAAITASPGASAGTLSFRVDHLVATQTTTFTAPPVAITSVSDAALSPVISGGTFDITLADGTSKTLTPDDASLQSVVKAINGEAGSAYKATVVQINPGEYTLQLTGKKAGLTGAFAQPVIDLLGSPVNTTEGSNAQITVGTTNPYVMTSATNTFADVLPGVTVTAVREQALTDARITIGVTPDVAGIAAKVQALVDNANVALSEIASQTKIKTGDVAAGVLVGDSAMRKLSQDILSAVSAGADGLGNLGATGSFSTVGVGLDRSGKLTFDNAKFTSAYAADPATTQKYFDSYTDVTHAKAIDGTFEPGWDTAGGLGRKLEAVALLASGGVTLPTDSVTATKQGVLSGLIQRRTDSIAELNDQVSAWDIRLDLRKTALNLQFTNLEVAMGKMKSQSSWLAGQLARLG